MAENALFRSILKLKSHVEPKNSRNSGLQPAAEKSDKTLASCSSSGLTLFRNICSNRLPRVAKLAQF